MAGIFLSYSRADREHAYRIVQGLRALGVDVWWDEDMPGVDWQYELAQRITDMAAVLVLWSKNSQNSRNVRDEARLADKKDKLINALVGVAEPPPPFDRINGLPIDGWDGREPHRGWGRLVQTAETYLVKAGDSHPGKIVAALAALEQDWQDRKQALAQAQEAFGEAQAVAAEASATAESARAALRAAQEDLARAGELRLSTAILRAAQLDCDEKDSAALQADAAERDARTKLGKASRELKRRTSALEGPICELLAPPITPTRSADALEEQRRLAETERLAEKQRDRDLVAETAPLAAIAEAEAEKLADEKRQRDRAETEAAEQARSAEAGHLATIEAADAPAKPSSEGMWLADPRAGEREAKRQALRDWLRIWSPFGFLFGSLAAVATIVTIGQSTRVVDVSPPIAEQPTPARIQLPSKLPEQAAQTAILGNWALAGLSCSEPIRFSLEDAGLVVSFAGDTSPVTIDRSASGASGVTFKARDGSLYRLDEMGTVSRLTRNDAIGMTKCGG